jgi:hypothetical protein
MCVTSPKNGESLPRRRLHDATQAPLCRQARCRGRAQDDLWRSSCAATGPPGSASRRTRLGYVRRTRARPEGRPLAFANSGWRTTRASTDTGPGDLKESRRSRWPANPVTSARILTPSSTRGRGPERRSASSARRREPGHHLLSRMSHATVMAACSSSKWKGLGPPWLELNPDQGDTPDACSDDPDRCPGPADDGGGVLQHPDRQGVRDGAGISARPDGGLRGPRLRR